MFKMLSILSKGLKNKIVKRSLILTGIIIVFLLLYFYVPGLREATNDAVIKYENPEELKNLIVSGKAYAPLIIFLLTLLQSFIVFLPLLLVMMAATVAIGPVYGILVMLASQVVAGYIAFKASDYFGSPFVELFVSKKSLQKMEEITEKYGKWGVLIARLVPFGSFDLVNFGAGLLKVRDRDFIIGTVVGCLPATVIYGILGLQIYNPTTLNFVGYLIFGIFLLFLIIFGIWYKKNHKKK